MTTKKRRVVVKSRKITNYTRWAAWEREVLSKVDRPAECQKLVKSRQQEMDDDRSEAELVADHFREELIQRGHDPDRDSVFIPSQVAADWLTAVTRTSSATNRATTHIEGLGIPELSRTKKAGRPGWRWLGASVGKKNTAMQHLHPAGCGGIANDRPRIKGFGG